MFKGLMRRSSSSSTPDRRSQPGSNGKKSSGIWRKKTDSKSKAASRGDDRERSLGDLSANPAPPSSGRRSYEPSVAGESVAEVDRDTRGVRRRDREPSSSPEPAPRRLNGDQSRSRDDSVNEESNRWREPQRWPPGDVSLPPLDTGAAHTTSDQFAADIASPGFSQFPMQYDNNHNYDSPNYNNPVSIPPPLMPGQSDPSPTSPAPFDPHIPQQFPGQFPTYIAEPYRPSNPAGEAADYYGDQGQSVQDQPGVRPNPPLVIPNSQAHLMPASPVVNPPPEPSDMGQIGSAAEFYADSPDVDNPVPQQQPPSQPPKPSKPNKPFAAPADIPSGPPSYDTPDASVPPEAPESASTQPVGHTQNSPTQSHGMGPAIGAALGAAAVAYMGNHYNNSSAPSSEHPSPSSYTQDHEPHSLIGQPGPAIYPNPALNNPNYASNPSHPDHQAVYHSSPFQSGGLAFQQRQRGPLDKFMDFWKDHEGVGMYEEYTEAIGVCKYCFEPGTTSKDAPRKHNYRPRRRSSDRFSNDSRVNKSSRYSSPSDDESRRRRSSPKRSWFGGLLSGYAVKSLFESPDFEDSYNVRPSRVSSPRSSFSDSESDSDHKSRPSRRRRRSSLSQSPGGSRRNSYSDPKRSRYEGPRLRSRSRSGSDSRSRSSSRSRSALRNFALGAAVGSVASAATSLPQKKRSRSPKRKGKGQKTSTMEESSSSSYVDISRPTTAGGLGSFFNAPSENKKKPRPQSRKGFFPFSNNNSSSSSLDDDLAFGSAYAKKPKKLKKGKGKKKDEDVNAKLLELGALATALAGSTQGRRSGEILAGKDSRRPQSAPSALKDDEWEDYSEGQESSVSSALAFGGSSQYGGSSSSSSSSEDSSDSGTSKWNWRWGSKKDKKKNEQKKDSPSQSDFPTGSILAGTALGTAALASGYRKEGEHFSSPSSSSSESLQQLDPIPASDPPQFNTGNFRQSPPAKEPAFIRTGPIPIQQPQPVTPVSQAVYSSQGEPAPVYNAPTVPPFFPPDAFYDPASGRQVYPQPSDVSSNWNRTHRRRESSPDFYPGPFQEFTTSSYKRRPVDQASVQFDLTEEQEDKERRAARRERERRDSDRDQSIQLLDHESEEENERREPRRVERLELEPERGRSRSRSRSSTRRDRSPDRRRSNDDLSSWVGPAAAGAISAATAAAAMSSGAPSESASESSQRHKERSAKRRADRRLPSSEVGWGQGSVEPARVEPKEPRTQAEPADVDAEDESQIAPEDQPRRGRNPMSRAPSTRPTHESYATYFAPEEIRHSPDGQTEHREDASMSTIPEDEPESPSQQDIEPPSQYLQGHPWSVIPRLNVIEPTPPHSQNGSVRDVASPDPVAAESSQKGEASRHEQGSTTGSRVSWGGNETREYEVPDTSSEQDSVDYEVAHEHEPDDMQRDSIDHGMTREPEGMQKGSIQQDIEFAAILNATTKNAGFDPEIVPVDPYYGTRSSPPQAEHREFSEPEPSWQKPAVYSFEPHGSSQDEVQTPPREESKPEAMDAPEVKRHREAIERFNTPKAKETMPGSFDEEPVRPTEDPSPRPVAKEKRPRGNDRPPRRRSSCDSARDDPRKTAIDVSRPEPVQEEPRSEKEQGPVNNDVPSKENQNVGVPGEFIPTAFAAFPPQPVSEEPRGKDEREPVKNETPWEDNRQSEVPRETERPVSPPSPGSGYRMSQDNLNKSELVLGEIPRAPSPSGYRLSQDDLSRSEFVLEDNRKPVPSREKEPAPAVSRLPLRRGRRSQDKLHTKNDNVASSEKGPKDTASAVSLPAGPKPQETNEDHSQPARVSKSDNPDFRDRSQPTSQQQQQRLQRSETTTRQGPKEPSPAATPREPPSEEYREKNERDIAPEEARKVRNPKDTSPAPRPLIWNEARSEDGPAPAVKDDAALENNSQPRASEETFSDEYVLAPNGEDRQRRDEPDSNDDNVPENSRGARDEEDINVQRYRFSRQQREERRRREEERRQETEGVAGPNGREEYEKARKDAEEHEPARSLETPVKVDDGKDDTEDSRFPFPLSVPDSRLRSRSISPPGSAKAILDVGPKSRSRPTSPELNQQRQSLHGNDGDRSRRHSMLDSPTAVPLQFRRPPSTSPTGRRSPSVGSPEPPAMSLSSPPERRARRRSMEFVNSREIMPLFLVEQNGQHQHPAEEQLPSLPSSKSSSRNSSPVEGLRAAPDEKGWEVVEPIQDRQVEEQSQPEPSTVMPSQEPALSQEEQPKADVSIPAQGPPELEKEGEKEISREIEVQKPIDEPFPPLPSSYGSLNAPVEDLSAVPDNQSQNPVDLSRDVQPEPSVSTPALQSEDEHQPELSTTIPSHERFGGDEAEKDFSEKAETQELIDEQLPPLPSSKGSSLNASVENLVPSEEDWNPVDLTRGVQEDQPELGLPSRETVGDDGGNEKEMANAPEPINEQLPPLPPSNDSSLNASVEDLGILSGEDSWNMVNQPEEQSKPDFSTTFPSQEPVSDRDPQPEERPESELSVMFPKEPALNKDAQPKGQPESDFSITVPSQEPSLHEENQPDDHQQPNLIPSQEPALNQPEDKPKSELTFKFPSQEPFLNQESQLEEQFTPHSLEPILEEAEDEIQPGTSTTIPSKPDINRDIHLNDEPKPGPSIMIPQEPSGDDNLEKGKEIEKALPDSQQEPPVEETTYKDPTSPETKEKDTSGWEVVDPIQNALSEEQAEPDFPNTAPSQQLKLSQDAQPDQPRDLSVTLPEEAVAKEEPEEKGKDKATDSSDAQQEQLTEERAKKDSPPLYERHQEDKAVNPTQYIQPEPQRKPSLSIAIPSQEPDDELEEKYAKAREKDIDFHEFDTIDEEWTASEIMREREKHKHEFDIHSPAELLWDPHKYFITPRPFGGMGSRSFGESLPPRSYEPPKIQDDDIDISDPDEDISPPELGPSGLPGKESSEPVEMTAPTQEEKSENSKDFAEVDDGEEQPIPQTQSAQIGEDKAAVPDIEVTPPVKGETVPMVPVTVPKEEEQVPSTPGFGGVVDAAVAAAVDTRESQPALKIQTEVKEDKPVVPGIEVTTEAKDETASDVAPATASKEEQTGSNSPSEFAVIVDAAFAAATGSTNGKAVPEERVAGDLPKGDLSPPAEQSTGFLDGSQQSENGQEPYRTLSPIMEEPYLESERPQSVDLAHDEHRPQENEETESEVPATENTSVSRAPIGEQLPVPEIGSTAIAPETERVLDATTEIVQNTGEASQESQPSDEAQSVMTETATSQDGYAESTQDSGTDFWDAVEKHEEGEGSIASSLERPIDTPTPREWRTGGYFEAEVPAQDDQVSPIEKFSESTPVEEERQDASTPKPEEQLLEKTGSAQAPIEAQNAISQSDIARDEPLQQIEPEVAGSEQLLGELPEQTEQLIADEPKSLVKPALEVIPEAAADIETPANVTEKFPQEKPKEENEKDRRYYASLEPLTETEAEHSQSADAAAGAGTFETSGEVPATDARHQSPKPAGARDVEPVPAPSESEPITPVEKSESDITAQGSLSLEAEQTPAPAPLSKPGTTLEDKQDVEDSGEGSKHGSPSTTLDEAASIKLPPSPHAELADANVPAATSDTLPPSVTPSEEPRQEQPIEREMPHFTAENESAADAGAPLTPAQKKKAKKERRKKRRSASVDESVPATPQDETASIDEIAPVKAPSVEKDNDIANEPTEAIPEQPREDDVPPADIEHTEAPETGVAQGPPKSDVPTQPEATSVQGSVAEAEPTQEKAQDDIAPALETSGTTGELTVTVPEPTQEERDITASVEPVSTSSDHVEEAPKEDPVVGTDVTAPVQDPTAAELSSAKGVPQDDPVHPQNQPQSAATNFQELPSLEKVNEEVPVTEPPSRTNSKKNKKKHRRSASSEVEQSALAEEVTDAPSNEVPSAPAASEEAAEEKAVESPVTETQEHLGPTMSKKQAKKERKKRRSMIFSMGQSPDEPPAESGQPTAVHETPAQELQQQPDSDAALQPIQTIPDNASAEGVEIVDAPADTSRESITPDLQGQVKVEEPREVPAQKSDEAIAQEAPQVNEKEEPKSDLAAQLDHSQSQSEARFEPKEAGLLTPTSESTLHPEQADAEDMSGNAKKKIRNHRRRRSRILEQLAEAEAERERERAQQASSEGNPTGTLPVTESKPTAPAEDSDLWTDPSISSQIEQGREVPFASPSSEQVDDNQVVPALNGEPRAKSSPEEPEAVARPIELNKDMETQAGHENQVQPKQQHAQGLVSTPPDQERELVPETAPATEEKTKESTLASRETAELPSIQTEEGERPLDIVGPVAANEPAATVDIGEVLEKPASDVLPSEQSSGNQEEPTSPQETNLVNDSPTAEPREEYAPSTPSRKRSRKEKKRARKRTKENHESAASPEGILSESTTALIEQPPLVSEQVEDTKLPQGGKQVEDPKAKIEDPGTTGEKAVQEPVEQPHRREPMEPVEEQPTAQPLENQQPLTQEKNKEVQEKKGQPGNFGEEQVTMQEPRSNNNDVEAVNESQADKATDSASESSTTSRRFKGVASIFPNLKRGTFRLPSKSQSVKDRAEDETTEPEVSHGFENEDATRVSEAPITSQEGQRERLSSAEPFDDEPSFQLSTTTNPETTITDVAIDVEVDEYYKVSILSDGTTSESPAIEIDPISGGSGESTEQSPDNERSAHSPPFSDEQSSTVVDSSPTAVDTSREVSPSRDLRRSPTKTPSPSRSLAPSPPLPEPRNRVERTDGARTTDRNGKPRLEIKPVESLRPRKPRSTSPIRKYMGNAWAQQTTKKHGENEVIRPPVRQNSLPVARRPQTPERKPILRPSSMSNFHGAPNMQQTPHSPDVPRSLRRKSKTTRDMSGDLRAASRALQEENGSQPPPTDINIERIASSSSYDPVTDKGKRPIRGMTDVYEAWGETPSSPRSPSRPPSVRHRRSMQHLQQLEYRLDQLISENRLLTVERDAAEDKLKKTTVARRKSDQALNSQNTDLRDRAEEVEALKKSVEWFQKEVNRLTEENEGLMGDKANLAAAHEQELREFQEFSAREIEELRTQYRQAITDTQDRIRWEVDEKNADLRRLREELQREREEVQKLQHKIASGLDNVLVLRDDQFFRAACHNLYAHVQHWVKRFSKHSDDLKYLKFDQLQEQEARTKRLEEDQKMAARLDVDKLDRLDVDKLIGRFDNTILDGSDVESYLIHRVGRRDVFMSVIMTMMWKFIFAPYMFGIDSEKQQKLNSLEEQLAEAGKLTAVRRWRATTLSLLSKSPSFAKQREIEIEAVMHEIYDTLESICPPPKEKEEDLHKSLRTVLQRAVSLSIEMRTQLDEYYMVRPLLAEFGANGVVTRRVHFNEALMNERSVLDSGAGEGSVRLFLFPLVVKEHDDDKEEDKGPVVIYPAQVLVNRPEVFVEKSSKSLDRKSSVNSSVPSLAA